ncbi:hypothetical protein COL516b_006376 [Colletotrichum fioriniae]|nr:uncharacterized protein COL516b_006376 [Colletotrichum fioriniae]KAJ0303931.1 hypothetical protein COL516b_006376 [Colletotrichum fioriniae]
MTDLNKELLDKALERVREVVSNVPINLETRVVDVSSKSEVEQAVNHLDSWGGLEVILNNAGVMHPRDGDTHECSAEVWNKTFDINVKGVCVINTASMVAIVGSATPQLAYTASKGAVMAHLGSYRFNTICLAPLKYVIPPLPFARKNSNGCHGTPMLQDFLGDDRAKRFQV